MKGKINGRMEKLIDAWENRKMKEWMNVKVNEWMSYIMNVKVNDCIFF